MKEDLRPYITALIVGIGGVLFANSGFVKLVAAGIATTSVAGIGIVLLIGDDEEGDRDG